MIVQPARLGGVQGCKGGILRYHNVGVVAEPLQAAIPNVAAYVVIGTRGYCKKGDVPRCGQHEADDNHALWEVRCTEELADSEKIRKAGHRERNDGKRFAFAAELARADD